MNQTIGVNITPQSFQPTLHFSQGDVGRVFVINVTDYDIPTGATVTCVATKPSGMGFTVSGTVSGNSVTFTSTAEMTDEWGRFPAEIRIASGNTLLGTANFLMIGEKDPHPASTIDGTQEELIPQLTLLVNRVEAAAESVHDLTVSATTLTAGSDATATYDSTNNSIAFGIPRGADGDVTRSEFNDLKSDVNTLGKAESETGILDGLIEKGIGWIYTVNGTFNKNYDYQFKKYDANIVKAVFIKTATIEGAGTAVANYFASDGTYLGHEFDGENASKTFTNVFLTIPSGTRYIFLNYKSDSLDECVYYDSSYIYDNLANPILQNFTKCDTIASGSGWVNAANGNLITNPAYEYKYKKIAYDSTLKYAVKNALLEGESIALVNFYDSNDNYLGYDYGLVGKNASMNYDGIFINPPTGTETFIIVSKGECDVLCSVSNSVLINKTYWTGKKILWLGTSIPATPYAGGQAYPEIVGESIGATVLNKAVSGSCARRRFDPNNLGEMVNLNMDWDMRSLSTSLAEIDDISANWNTYKSHFANAPDSLSAEYIQFLQSNSYETRIDPYLDDVDLIVFDHGRNDYPKMINQDDLFDKAAFVGAMNFLIQHIYEHNPRTRICMVSHYENQEFDTVVEYQEYVANYWSIPLFRLDKMLGWSNRTITTKHAWNGGVFEESSTDNTMPVHRAWLKDDLHPYLDDTGEATKLIANAITAWIKTVV